MFVTSHFCQLSGSFCAIKGRSCATKIRSDSISSAAHWPGGESLQPAHRPSQHCQRAAPGAGNYWGWDGHLVGDDAETQAPGIRGAGRPPNPHGPLRGIVARSQFPLVDLGIRVSGLPFCLLLQTCRLWQQHPAVPGPRRRLIFCYYSL